MNSSKAADGSRDDRMFMFDSYCKLLAKLLNLCSPTSADPTCVCACPPGGFRNFLVLLIGAEKNTLRHEKVKSANPKGVS
jgi:hypothetical protein